MLTSRFCHNTVVLVSHRLAKTLAEIGGPYKIRTCDTVVKSQADDLKLSYKSVTCDVTIAFSPA